MKFRSAVVVAALVVAFLSCGKDAPPAGSVKSDGSKVVGPGSSLNPLSPPVSENPPAPVDGVLAFVTTPERQAGIFQRTPDANRDVPAKTFDLVEFKRTIEDTDLV